MINFKAMVTRSQKTFPSHKKLLIRVKKSPSNPFNSSIFGKIIEMSSFPKYQLYIHTNENCSYITLYSLSIKNSEDIKLPLDDKLWIELLFVFDFVKVLKK